MNLLRAAMIIAGGTLNVAWLVSVCVRSSIGAPDLNPQLAAGPLPLAPPSLAPLIIPARDPFAADMLKRSPSGAILAAAGTPYGPNKNDLSSVNVPDVAAFASGGNNFGVVATIVGRDEAYALVEDGAAVHVVHVGDRFGASTVAEIAIDRVRLSNGTQIAMAVRHASGPPAVSLAAAPSPSPSPSPSAAPSLAPAMQSDRAGEVLRSSYRVQPPTGTVAQPHPSIGAPSLTQPNGNPAPSFGGSVFPGSLPTPSVVPIGGTMPGGH